MKIEMFGSIRAEIEIVNQPLLARLIAEESTIPCPQRSYLMTKELRLEATELAKVVLENHFKRMKAGWYKCPK